MSKPLINLDVVGHSNHQQLLCSVRVSSGKTGSHGLLTDIRCFKRRTVRSQEKEKVIQKQHAGLDERFDIASMRPAKTVANPSKRQGPRTTETTSQYTSLTREPLRKNGCLLIIHAILPCEKYLISCQIIVERNELNSTYLCIPGIGDLHYLFQSIDRSSIGILKGTHLINR